MTVAHSISAIFLMPSPQSSTLKSLNGTTMGSFSSITIMRVLCSIKKETFSNNGVVPDFEKINFLFEKVIFLVAQYFLDSFFSEYFFVAQKTAHNTSPSSLREAAISDCKFQIPQFKSFTPGFRHSARCLSSSLGRPPCPR